MVLIHWQWSAAGVCVLKDVFKVRFRCVHSLGFIVRIVYGCVCGAVDGRIIHVLVSEPLLPNHSVGPERQCINAECAIFALAYLGRNAHVVHDASFVRRRFFSCSSYLDLRNSVLLSLCPRPSIVFAHEPLEMVPDDTAGNIEVVDIHVAVVHNRKDRRSHTDNCRLVNAEGITREHFIHVERNKLARVHG